MFTRATFNNATTLRTLPGTTKHTHRCPTRVYIVNLFMFTTCPNALQFRGQRIEKDKPVSAVYKNHTFVGSVFLSSHNMIFYSIIFCFLFIIFRVLYLLISLNLGGKVKFSKRRTGKVKTMIVLGSGGRYPIVRRSYYCIAGHFDIREFSFFKSYCCFTPPATKKCF